MVQQASAYLEVTAIFFQIFLDQNGIGIKLPGKYKGCPGWPACVLKNKTAVLARIEVRISADIRLKIGIQLHEPQYCER